MSKLSSVSVLVISLLLFATAASADNVSVYGGFTSLNGVILGSGGPSIINGQQYCPDAGCGELVGMAHITFASPQSSLAFQVGVTPNNVTPNLVEFTPASPQAVSGPGVEFLLGTFTIANGIWTGDADFGFQLTTASGDPALDGHTFTGFMHMALTTNDFVINTPEQNADIYDLRDANGLILNLPSIRIYELDDSPTGSNIGSVSLYGSIGSLDLTKLADPTGASFLSDSHGPLSSVPEPGSVTMLASGLSGLVMRFGKRRR